jgi:hypothetical protein
MGRSAELTAEFTSETLALLREICDRNDGFYVVEPGTVERPPRVETFLPWSKLTKPRQAGPGIALRPMRTARPRESRRDRRPRARSPGSKRNDPPESEPPLGGSHLAPRPCEVCGRDFTPQRRSNARLCGATCKQKAYRARRAATIAAAVALPQPQAFLNAAHGDPYKALIWAVLALEPETCHQFGEVAA